nr:hypothetical protein [Agrobacterium fabrum]
MAFYAAFDIETCIAEMRPSVGSIVIGAEFEITKPVWVLDTTRFAGPFKEPNLFPKTTSNARRNGDSCRGLCMKSLSLYLRAMSIWTTSPPKR